MIPLIQKTLRGEYEFVKLSTPNSGKSLMDKVVFLAFKKGEGLPSYCIKTIRSYGAKETVVRSFENLTSLNTLTKGSPHAILFPQALSLHDDGEAIFSIEEAAVGSRERLTDALLAQLIGAYTGFQAHVAKGPLRSVDEFARELLLPELLKKYEALPSSNLRLPRALQLGDLTEDNALFSLRGPQIVDYDRVGELDLPGFDLFGLLRRFNPAETRSLCGQYFPHYFEAIGAEGGGSYERLLFLCYALERTQRKDAGESAQKIVEDFARIV